jgi:microcystin-dependent protein
MSNSLLLLKKRSVPSSVKPKYVSNDYAIWDQPEFDKDPGPEEQKKHMETVENQLGFLMRKTWRTPVPVATVVQYAGTNAPIGWLFCNGTSYDISSYPDLFQVIEYTYGGSGNTFKVPDFRQRVPVGYDPDYTFSDISQALDLSLNHFGQTGGELAHKLIIQEMPSHRHGDADVSGNTDGNGNTTENGLHGHSVQDPGHSHTITTSSGGTDADYGGQGLDLAVHNTLYTNNNQTGISIDPSGNHIHNTFKTGGSKFHNNMQPYVVINYIIRW